MKTWFTVSVLHRLGFTEDYIEADSATDAIKKTREEWGYDAGAISARKSVFGEWDCGAENFTIGGEHIPH